MMSQSDRGGGASGSETDELWRRAEESLSSDQLTDFDFLLCIKSIPEFYQELPAAADGVRRTAPGSLK